MGRKLRSSAVAPPGSINAPSNGTARHSHGEATRTNAPRGPRVRAETDMTTPPAQFAQAQVSLSSGTLSREGRWRTSEWRPLWHFGHIGIPHTWRLERETVYRLLAGCLSQGFVDPVLPAGAGPLEVLEHVPIDAKGDRLFGIRDGGLPGHWRRNRLRRF